MIMALNPYPDYRGSGVEWLGDVPEHWEVRRMKRIASLNPSKAEARRFLKADTPVTFLPMERVRTDGRIDGELLSASAVWNGFSYFRRSDVLVAKITPCFENGKGACLDALPTEVGFGSTEFHVLRAGHDISPRFLHLLTTLPEFRQSGADAMTGAAGQQRVPQAFVENYSLPLPPLPEQATIVRYLDHAEERIRRSISAKDRLAGLLEEQRQAVIHHAVTRGLDPNVRLKPSGIEWLGDVPVHWDVRRLKHWVGINETVLPETTNPDFEFRYLEIGAVGTGVLIDEPSIIRFADAPSRARRIVRSGDTIVSTVRTYLKAVWFAEDVNDDLICSTGFAVLTPRQETAPKFVSYLAQSNAFTDRVTAESVGIAYPAIAESRLSSFHVCVPPLPEQVAIVEYLDKATAEIDAAIARARRHVELLREYRTRLIADVVTGKLDMREAAMVLSEKADESNRLGETDECPEPETAHDHAD